MKRLLFLSVFLGLVSIQAQETILFQDNFDDQLYDGWTIVDDPEPVSGPSVWSASGGELYQSSNIWAYDPPEEFFYHLGSHAVTGDSEWTDYTLNALLRSTDNDGIGLIFRYHDKSNYYRILLMNDAGNSGEAESAIQRIQKFVNGEPITLHQNKVDEAYPSGYFSLTADVRGDTIKAYLNGELIGSAIDDDYDSGKIGVLVYANSGARFDSIMVTQDVFIYEEPEIEITYPVTQDRQPYIQNPTTDKVEIAWRSVEKFVGTVEIGEEKGVYTRIIEEPEATQKHHVVIDGLEANSTYFYRVWNEDDVVLEDYMFKTAKPDSIEQVSFFILGDSGVDTDIQRQVRDRMVESYNADAVDFAIHVGDVHQGDGSTYDRIYFDIYNELLSKINVFTCIGNHDTYTDNAAPYLDDFYLPSNNDENSERYYSFRWGTTFFINLDSNLDMTPSSPQYKFLVQELDSEEQKSADWTFVYFHHPPYCEYWPAWEGDQEVRDHLMPLFEDYDVDIVFNGHTHAYEYGELNHVHYVISGGGGGSLDEFGRDFAHITNSQAKYHFSRVDIDGKVLEFEATDLDGVNIHEFSINKENLVSREMDEEPASFSLKQNYPNPFNPNTTIEYELSEMVNVSVMVYDSLGREVKVLVDAMQPGGLYRIDFDGTGLASGTYVVELVAGSFNQKIQMTLLK